MPSFITLSYLSYREVQQGARYDFSPFPMDGLSGETPGAQTWEVSADLLAMFNDTPDAELLVKYLAMEKAQQIWPFTPGGGAISANLQVLPKKYPDPVAQAIAGIVTGPTTLCFNASDEMPDTLQSAFYQEVMDYLQDPGQLDTILKKLDQLRKTTYQSFHPSFSCGSQ